MAAQNRNINLKRLAFASGFKIFARMDDLNFKLAFGANLNKIKRRKNGKQVKAQI